MLVPYPQGLDYRTTTRLDLARIIHAHIADLAVVRALEVFAVESTLPEELSGVAAAAVLGIGQISLIARMRQVKHPAIDIENQKEREPT